MKEYWSLIVKFSLFIALILVLVLNISGFCWQKFKYLSHQEKVEAIYTQTNNFDTVRVGDVRYKRVPYSSFEEFIRENPNCCITNYRGGYDDNPSPTFFGNISGNYSEIVKINYKIYYEKNGIKYQDYTDGTVLLTSCGKFPKFSKW